jgi:hypothetical protein
MLEYWAAYGIASQFVRPAQDAPRSQAASVGLLQRALIDEYATLYSLGDTAKAPILRRIVERYGPKVLSEVLSSAAAPDSPVAFIEHWLAISPAYKDRYMDTLTDIGREAIRVGRRDSFALVVYMLFGEDSEWSERLEAEWLAR